VIDSRSLTARANSYIHTFFPRESDRAGGSSQRPPIALPACRLQHVRFTLHDKIKILALDY
jgi:hypothetical protein